MPFKRRNKNIRRRYSLSVGPLESKSEVSIQINNEIITRIQTSILTNTIDTFRYKCVLTPDDKFFLEEILIKTPVSEIVNKWKCTITFTEVPDLFNVAVNYNPSNFSELVSFHESTQQLLKKFAFFAGSPNADVTIGKLKSNYEIIQQCLGSIEEQILPKISSEKQEIIDKINVLNATIQSLKQKNVEISVGSLWKWGQIGKGILTDKTFSSTSSGGYSSAFLDKPCTAACKWRLRLDSVGAWDGIGVAAKTTPQDSWSGGEKDRFLLSFRSSPTVPFNAYPAGLPYTMTPSTTNLVAGNVLQFKYGENAKKLTIFLENSDGSIKETLFSVSDLPSDVWPYVVLQAGSVSLL